MIVSGLNFEDNKPIKTPVDDDTKAQSSSTTVPMVEEKADNDFQIPDIYTGNKPTISNSTNPLSETYRDLQSLRAKAKGCI